MKSKMILVLFFISSLLADNFNKLCNAQDVDELYYNVIASFPTPGSSPQGLAWDSTYIWLSDDSTDTIYKISPVDGSVIFSFCTPGTEPRGMTYDGTNLWNLDDSLRKIYKLNKDNGTVIDSLNLPTEFNGMPVEEYPFTGLAWDGDYLWTAFSAGWSSSVLRMNPENGNIDTFFFCYSQDMAFDGAYLWNAAQGGQNKGMVSKRDIPSGNRIAYFRTPGYYPTGLSFDGTYFWLTDIVTDTLYQIQLITTGFDNRFEYKFDFPHSFKLFQNYPNPFNSQTVITYELNKTIFVQLKVYDLIGKDVVTLINGKQTAGSYQVSWNGKNKNGKEMSSSIYLYQLRTENFSQSKKMILIR